jgi:hypothetical protein
LSNEEKTNDYENFEKGMIYMKILKKGGAVEKRGRRKRNQAFSIETSTYLIPQALVARTTPLFLTFCLQIYFQ